MPETLVINPKSQQLTTPAQPSAINLATQIRTLRDNIETLCQRNVVFFWKKMGASSLLSNIAEKFSQTTPEFTHTELEHNRSRLLTMLRRANESVDCNKYAKLIAGIYNILCAQTKASSLNLLNSDGEILDPISGEVVDPDNSIELSTGYSYNLDSVRYLAQKPKFDNLPILHKNDRQTHRLLKQDIEHIEAQLIEFTRSHLAQHVAYEIPIAKPTQHAATHDTTLTAQRGTTLAVTQEAQEIAPDDQEILQDFNWSYCDFSKFETEIICTTKPAKNINLSNANLTNKDISALDCEQITFNKKTKLDGTRLSAALTEKADASSRKIIRKALVNTYYKNSSFFSLSSWKLWTKEWRDYINGKYDDLSSTLTELQEQADHKSDKAAYETLTTHGLFAISETKAEIIQTSLATNSRVSHDAQITLPIST